MQQTLLAADHPSVATMLLMIPIGGLIGLVALFMFMRFAFGGGRREPRVPTPEPSFDEMTVEEAHEIVAAVRSGELTPTDARERAVYEHALRLLEHRRSNY